MADEELSRFMKDIHITYCSCGKYLEKQNWKPFKNIKDVISKKVNAKVTNAKIDFEDFDFPQRPKEIVKNEIIVTSKKKEHFVGVSLKLARCNLCEKEGSQYFEAVLQVRCASEHLLEKSVGFIKEKIESLRHRGMFINNVKKFPDGYDLYVTNRKLARSIGKELHDTYGGVHKASPHLYSRNRQTSKNLYRVNVFVRLPGFEKGDFIVDDNHKVFRVEKLGKVIKLLNLEKGSASNISYKKLKYHLLKKQNSYVTKVRPHLEVIHPLDYQSTPVKNKPGKMPELGSEVKVVVHKGVYIAE